MINKELGNVLEEAFEAYEKGEYAISLSNYEWFFYNATNIDSSWLGAKYRSLEEWYCLAQKYEPAYKSLISRKQEALKEFQNIKNADSFREYARICHILKFDNEMIDFFRNLQKVNFDLTKEIYKYVEDILIEQNQWTICEVYINDSIEAYEKKLAIFDQLIKISKGAYNGEFDNMYLKKFIQDINNLIEILKSAKRFHDIDLVIEKLNNDMQKRNYEPIIL